MQAKQQDNFSVRTTLIDSKEYAYQVYVSPQARNIVNPPIIIFLHGIRERGTGGFVPTGGPMRMLLEQYLNQIPAIVILPQCRPDKYWHDPTMDKMVMQALDETARDYNADAKRIYLIGLSMGGFGVWHFASQHPNKFAAVISICGGSPILSGERFQHIGEAMTKTPSWLFHGAEDRVVPVTESREIVKALRENQCDVKYNEYPGVGHGVWMQVLGEPELMPWLLSQRLN